MLKLPISGPPHSGKTTLIAALHEDFPEAYFVGEPAESVILEEHQKQEAARARGEMYHGIHPVDNYPAFAPLVLKKALEMEAAIPPRAELVFQDRSLIDHVAYDRFYRYTEMLPLLQRHIAAARYTLTFFCEPVGVFTPTHVRREDPTVVQNIHEQLAKAYEEADLPVVQLPAVSVAERVAIIHETLNKLRGA